MQPERTHERVRQEVPRKGDPEWGPVCACGGPKSKKARRCMACRRASAKTKQQQWRDWYGRNRERVAATQRVRRAADPVLAAQSLAGLAEWRKAHPEQVAATLRRAKHRRRRMSRLDSEYAETLYRDPCSYCGGGAEHADHIRAVSKGGGAGWENLTASCARCNHAKSARPLLAFLISEKERVA
jgi:5-methylcytosine-specific restriction endonuclease McrA